MAMSDNPQYAHATAAYSKVAKTNGLKPLRTHQGAGEGALPEQMELLALSSDNSYPQEGSPPVSAVLSPSNNSVFNYQLPPTQPRVYHQMAYGIQPKPKLVQQQPMVAQQQQVAQQLSPPHTLHPGQAMSIQQQQQQGQTTRGYPQMTPQPQHMYNQSVSPPSSVSAAPGPFQNELLAALTHVINGQHQQQQQQAATQQQLNFIKQQEKARQQKLQLHKNEMLRRRLSRWETLTQQNRGYLLSLNNVEDQFRAICALSLLAVPEPQY